VFPEEIKATAENCLGSRAFGPSSLFERVVQQGSGIFDELEHRIESFSFAFVTSTFFRQFVVMSPTVLFALKYNIGLVLYVVVVLGQQDLIFVGFVVLLELQ
jgi:hypothetical protein